MTPKHAAAIITAILCLSCALAISACGIQQRQVVPTRQVIKQTGLPQYPNAKPLSAHATTMSSGLGKTTQLVVAFQTPDDVGAVDRFYARALPKTAQRQTITIAGIQMITFTQTTTSGSKQIALTKMNGSTLIQLTTMTLSFGGTAPSGATPVPSGATPSSSAPGR